MTDLTPHSNNPPELTVALLQQPGEEDIPYSQRVYRAGWDAAMAVPTCPHLRQGDSGSNWCELAEQGAPHAPAITGRPPRPDECDAGERVWVWRDGIATGTSPAWRLTPRDTVQALQQFYPETCWRPFASLPMEGKP